MPAVQKGAKILVTGANGFIAAATVKILVERGYNVIGVVRTSTKGEWLAKKFGSAFTYVVVPDIEKPDAYDSAVELGPDAILHMASPVTLLRAEPQSVIGPAVNGTVNILSSLLKFSSTVKRVVITSSAASIEEPKDGPYIFTEKDWNNHSPAVVEKEGNSARPVEVYCTSKVRAERAAWDFMEKNKDKISFDLVTLLPPLVYGPNEQEPPEHIRGLNMSSFQIYQNLTTVRPEPPTNLNLIDVRDVALGHALVLEHPEVSGERFILSNGPFVWAQLRDAAINAGIKGIAPGTPEGFVAPKPKAVIDGSKATRVLGLQYRPQNETAIDAIKSIYELFPEAIPG